MPEEKAKRTEELLMVGSLGFRIKTKPADSIRHNVLMREKHLFL